MKYTINPYSQLVFDNGKYEIYAPPSKSSTTKTELKEINEKNVLNLTSDKWFTYEELTGLVGADIAEFLIENKIFTDSLPDENSVSSRTKQFYKQHLSKNQHDKISQANILILGCGGIGSTIAWLFAGLGVKKLTIVDFDAVEISNLNRMFMFDKSDIGKKKVNVIKEKIENLYPDININVLDKKILSENDLAQICLMQKYTVIIKALDSPTAFPLWLDSVCKKHKLKYISGITLRDRIIVGPSYIPGVSEYGWSDIIHLNGKTERIYGKVPSIGIMLFHTSDMMALEAIKIITENYDSCEYKNCIYSENIFTGEKEIMRNKSSKSEDNSFQRSHSFFNILVMIGFGICSLYNGHMLPIISVLSIILPFFSYCGKKYIFLQTFINSSVYSVFLTVLLLENITFNVLSFCLVSIVVTSVVCLFNLLICNIIIKFKKII